MTGGRSPGDALSSRRSLSQALRGDSAAGTLGGCWGGDPLPSLEGPSATQEGVTVLN